MRAPCRVDVTAPVRHRSPILPERAGRALAAPESCACRVEALGLPCTQRGPGRHTGLACRPARRVFAAGATVFCQGALFRQIHVVRSGTFKSTLLLADGRRQVCGFHFPGDLLGLDGIAEERHGCTLTALEAAHTCAFDYVGLMAQTAELRALRHDLHRRMSAQLASGKTHLHMLAQRGSAQRLAGFLIDLSDQARRCGRPFLELHLPMTRADIGSYLGMTLETVSRLLGDFERRGDIAVDCRRVHLLKPARLGRAWRREAA